MGEADPLRHYRRPIAAMDLDSIRYVSYVQLPSSFVFSPFNAKAPRIRLPIVTGATKRVVFRP